MELIILNWVKYYTKEVIKTVKLITIGSAIVLTVVCIKYKPAYKVTISGETVGFIINKDLMESKISKYIKDTSNNIAFREIENMPEYELKLINRNKNTNEQEIMLAVENITKTTYKFYAINSNTERRATLTTQEEADKVINEVKAALNPEVDLKLGIVEIYTEEYSVNAYEEAKNSLNEVKGARLFEYEAEKAEKERIAREEAKKRAVAYTIASSYGSVDTSGPSGSISGMALSRPVAGSISSRFGSRSSIRSSVHTGLDIATSAGTGIRPAASGTVTFAAYKGSYGNLIIINHGNGIETYYAHCSAIYVSPGQAVDTGSVIGAVGATGNATGPHLHLEIRQNGTPLNPENYLY